MQNTTDPVEVSAGTETHEIWLIFNFTLKKYFGADRKYEVGSRCTAVNVVCVRWCSRAFRKRAVGEKSAQTSVTWGNPAQQDSSPKCSQVSP